ncbi:MAG TPA: hypothetical protein VJL78_07855 [Candidatus Nitrosocosmicus sp.]|nr:hypothetical protein [Candidatus Nitrosocosmicus sp.]
MIELSKVESENKVYVNDKVNVLDRVTITASELLELARFSSLVYDLYLTKNGEKKVNIETVIQFNATLKEC